MTVELTRSEPTIDNLTLLPPRRFWRRISSAVVLVLAALLVWAIATNGNLQWDVVSQYIFSRNVLDGLRLTIVLTIISMAVGLVLGTLVAVMRLSGYAALSMPAAAYVTVFRGTPLLVQIVFWYNLAAIFPDSNVSIFGFVVYNGSVNDLITPLTASVLALGLNEGAYMSEIIRAGIIGVNNGQWEAARALGMPGGMILRRIVLPQAMRTIIPPTGNETIGMLKFTSLVSVIALPELLFSVQAIYSQNFKTIPLLLVASIWYLIMTTVLSIGQHYLERYFSRGHQRSRQRAPRRAVGDKGSPA